MKRPRLLLSVACAALAAAAFADVVPIDAPALVLKGRTLADVQANEISGAAIGTHMRPRNMVGYNKTMLPKEAARPARLRVEMQMMDSYHLKCIVLELFDGAVLAGHPTYDLRNWIAKARSCADGDEELADYYETDARRIITVSSRCGRRGWATMRRACGADSWRTTTCRVCVWRARVRPRKSALGRTSGWRSVCRSRLLPPAGPARSWLTNCSPPGTISANANDARLSLSLFGVSESWSY